MVRKLGRFSDSALDLAGALLLVVVVGLIAATAWLAYQHNSDLSAIQANTAKTEQLAKAYLNEQQALARGGKDTAIFAEWLVQAQSAICSADHADCPKVPTIQGLGH